MSKKFLLDLPNSEHQALKIAAAQANASMHTFIRDAIAEKIQRGQASATLHAPSTDGSEIDVLAEASEKPASYNDPIRPKDVGEDENPPGGSDRVG